MDIIIVGLGNKGDKYQFNRHNIGRFFLERLITNQPADFQFPDFWQDSKKFLAKEIGGEIGNKKVAIFLPETMMNLSGRSVRKILDFYGRDNLLLVVHDDLDLTLGQMRLSFGSGSGGHKGVESINKELANKNYYRLRLGIGRPDDKDLNYNKDIRDFVLDDFNPEEKDKVESLFADFCSCLEVLIKEGPQSAMNIFNSSNRL
ncbi:MAG TPA: aminoacyl-tRNA hydrolase [Candidatus Atribacteria bacterium]|nr:aminoacyl-tRNA hydrolase [Candidatus Atribacteria bacterium]